MRLLKQALGVLGTLVVVAVMVALVAPNKARAMVVSMVKIVPGTTTQVGQNESQLVSLTCENGSSNCLAFDPQGNLSTSGYVVPAGYTLVVTDYQFFGSSGGPGVYNFDLLLNGSTQAQFAEAGGLGDAGSTSYGHEHYSTGIRIGSGVPIEDLRASQGAGSFAFVQGYLVPND
jgi:hypothetical protein